jgi:hypothetical protein
MYIAITWGKDTEYQWRPVSTEVFSTSDDVLEYLRGRYPKRSPRHFGAVQLPATSGPAYPTRWGSLPIWDLSFGTVDVVPGRLPGEFRGPQDATGQPG